MTTMALQPREQSRARYPDEEGYVERDGVRSFYEVYGDGPSTILLLPTWSIVHSRHWKAQIPFLSRHFRVVTFDGRGNGGSDSPQGVAAYDPMQFALDALAVMDRTGTEGASLVALSRGALWATILAAEQPERVSRVTYLGPSVPLSSGHEHRALRKHFDEPLEDHGGWAKFNRHYWQSGPEEYRDFLEFFFGQMFNEPHSTKQIEDAIGWGLGIDPLTLADTSEAAAAYEGERFRDLAGRVECPSLVIHGDNDMICPHSDGAKLADLTGGELVTIEGGGHGVHARDPVRINHLLRDFSAGEAGRPRMRSWARARSRGRRALYVSSPIGLGHARRDVAIARELRRLVPDLEIDWLAQDPVTRVLKAEGERIHPASAQLANESGHIESESA